MKQKKPHGNAKQHGDADRHGPHKDQIPAQITNGKLGRRKEPTPLRIAGVQGTQPNSGYEAKREMIPRSHRGTFIPVMSTEERQ